MRRLLLALSFLTLMLAPAGCATGRRDPPPSDANFTAQVNAFVDAWHDDAAHARPAFFDKIASDGIYIGTDKRERWGREAFRECPTT